MFDIGDKDKLIQTIKANIECHTVNIPYSYNESDLDRALVRHMADIIEHMAKDIAKLAVQEIINHLYTCSEFETDLGLRK
jgi:hypothetical protein